MRVIHKKKKKKKKLQMRVTGKMGIILPFSAYAGLTCLWVIIFIMGFAHFYNCLWALSINN